MRLDEATRAALRGERRLAAALGALEIVPASVTPLAALQPWSRTPRTYEVVTATDERLKIRFARRARFAERAARLTRRLGDPRVPPPLAVSGTAMVERWVEGEPLSSLPLSGARVDAAADLLASIHRSAAGRRSTARLCASVARRATALVEHGLLSPEIAAWLGRLVAETLPAEAAWGVTHGDFCAENLVVAGGGLLASIDNEQFAWGFPAYDVARSWYRWPMPAWAEERFARRYAAGSGTACGPVETQAWRAVAVVRALQYRRASRSSPAGALRALARVLGDGPAAP